MQAPPNVIGGTAQAMATEVDGRVLITRHDGGASLAIDIGGFIRDADLGQTYQVVRRADGAIVRQWGLPQPPAGLPDQLGRCEQRVHGSGRRDRLEPTG